MPTGILSNSFVGAREREQAVYGFEDLVDEIIYSHECGMAKPDPRIYALTCERFQVEPAQMAFLDDFEQCVDGHGRRASTRCCTRTTLRPSRTSRPCLRRDGAVAGGLGQGCDCDLVRRACGDRGKAGLG
jgi:beta-phosphoglucomutase-like phosphatase (HAD superfamily)